MGDYTQMKFYVRLRGDTPASVLDVLRASFTSEEAVLKELRPDHPFFRAPRWTRGQCAGSTCARKHRSVSGIPRSLDSSLRTLVRSSGWIVGEPHSRADCGVPFSLGIFL